MDTKHIMVIEISGMYNVECPVTNRSMSFATMDEVILYFARLNSLHAEKRGEVYMPTLSNPMPFLMGFILFIILGLLAIYGNTHGW